MIGVDGELAGGGGGRGAYGGLTVAVDVFFQVDGSRIDLIPVALGEEVEVSLLKE